MRPHSMLPKVDPAQFRFWATVNCLWAIGTGLLTPYWWLAALGVVALVAVWRRR